MPAAEVVEINHEQLSQLCKQIIEFCGQHEGGDVDSVVSEFYDVVESKFDSVDGKPLWDILLKKFNDGTLNIGGLGIEHLKLDGSSFEHEHLKVLRGVIQRRKWEQVHQSNINGTNHKVAIKSIQTGNFGDRYIKSFETDESNLDYFKVFYGMDFTIPSNLKNAIENLHLPLENVMRDAYASLTGDKKSRDEFLTTTEIGRLLCCAIVDSRSCLRKATQAGLDPDSDAYRLQQEMIDNYNRLFGMLSEERRIAVIDAIHAHVKDEYEKYYKFTLDKFKKLARQQNKQILFLKKKADTLPEKVQWMIELWDPKYRITDDYLRHRIGRANELFEYEEYLVSSDGKTLLDISCPDSDSTCIPPGVETQDPKCQIKRERGTKILKYTDQERIKNEKFIQTMKERLRKYSQKRDYRQIFDNINAIGTQKDVFNNPANFSEWLRKVDLFAVESEWLRSYQRNELSYDALITRKNVRELFPLDGQTPKLASDVHQALEIFHNARLNKKFMDAFFNLNDDLKIKLLRGGLILEQDEYFYRPAISVSPELPLSTLEDIIAVDGNCIYTPSLKVAEPVIFGLIKSYESIIQKLDNQFSSFCRHPRFRDLSEEMKDNIFRYCEIKKRAIHDLYRPIRAYIELRDRIQEEVIKEIGKPPYLTVHKRLFDIKRIHLHRKYGSDLKVEGERGDYTLTYKRRKDGKDGKERVIKQKPDSRGYVKGSTLEEVTNLLKQRRLALGLDEAETKTFDESFWIQGNNTFDNVRWEDVLTRALPIGDISDMEINTSIALSIFSDVIVNSEQIIKLKRRERQKLSAHDNSDIIANQVLMSLQHLDPNTVKLIVMKSMRDGIMRHLYDLSELNLESPFYQEHVNRITNVINAHIKLINSLLPTNSPYSKVLNNRLLAEIECIQKLLGDKQKIHGFLDSLPGIVIQEKTRSQIFAEFTHNAIEKFRTARENDEKIKKALIEEKKFHRSTFERHKEHIINKGYICSISEAGDLFYIDKKGYKKALIKSSFFMMGSHQKRVYAKAEDGSDTFQEVGYRHYNSALGRHILSGALLAVAAGISIATGVGAVPVIAAGAGVAASAAISSSVGGVPVVGGLVNTLTSGENGKVSKWGQRFNSQPEQPEQPNGRYASVRSQITTDVKSSERQRVHDQNEVNSNADFLQKGLKRSTAVLKSSKI